LCGILPFELELKITYMVKNLRYSLTPLIITLITSVSAQDTDCDGFRTQTQGGWGTSASGHNPGAYRDTHFDVAFPDGITLGCDYTLTFESSAAVEDFLPSGGTARALTEDYVNPTNYSNVLAGQLLALTLSVGFDLADADFSQSSENLGDLIVNDGTFNGISLGEILEIGNQVLGGCSAEFSPSEVNAVLSAINENYVDGTNNNGFLDCPDEESLPCSIELAGLSTECTQSGSYTLTMSIAGSNGSFAVSAANALSVVPSELCFGPLESESNTITVVLEFPEGEDYLFNIIPSDNPDCNANPESNCQSVDVAGVAPDCCALTIDCGDAGGQIYSCISEIPDTEDLVSYSSDGCGELSLQVSETIQGTGCQDSPLLLTRTYTITNGAAMKSCSQTFTVIDDEAPVLVCPPDQYAECAAFIAPDAYATASDNCDSEVQLSYSNGSAQDCGFFVRTWTATDDCGNSTVCYQNVYVEDTQAPQIIAPGNVVLDCGTPIDPSYTGSPDVFDLCSDVDYSYEDVETASIDCSISITRLWTATDACGNTAVAEQLISITDLSGPTIYGLVGNQNFQCTDVPDAPEVFAVDQCSGDTLDVVMDEFITEAGCRKTVLRTYTATDNCGNNTTLSNTITIEDTQGPAMTCPEDVLLSCGDTDIDPSTIGLAEAVDDCSQDIVTITYEDSEYISNACPPRILRTWTAVDTCGNASNCVQMILFDDQEPPAINCLEDITINCSEATTDPEFTGTPDADDLCSEVILDYTDGPFDGNCPVSFVRTWSATDACGNASYCYQVITVIDEEGPDLVCPPTANVSCGASFEPYNTGYASATDQCLDVTLTYTDGDLTGDCEKQFSRTWMAIDACGNTTSCTQLIIVVDQMNPYISCPPSAIVECGGETDPSLTGEPYAVDYCSEVELSYEDVEDFNACPPMILRTWTATDICGNSRSCVQMIEVTGGGELEITCPDDLTISCEEEADPSLTGMAIASASCSQVSITYADSLALGQNTESEDCGQLRTQTQGGWGSKANGNNPGTYRDANFESAFPDGLTIGCDYTLTLTSSSAVQDFLPSGGPVRVITENLVDPSNYHSVLAGQLVAATLSVGFDVADESFSESTADLGDYTLSSGPMEGMTVSEVIAEANAFIGGCESAFSGSVLNTTLTAINESFVDGSGSGGTLNCPESTESDNCMVIYRTWLASDACGNEVSCTQVITQGSASNALLSTQDMTAYPSPASSEVNLTLEHVAYEPGTLIVINLAGVVVHKEVIASGSRIFKLDLSNYHDGMYSVTFRTKDKVYTTKFVKM
jgi:hypothetical protein